MRSAARRGTIRERDTAGNARRRPATRGAEASDGAEAEETGIALGDLLSQEGLREPDRAVRGLEKTVGANPHDARTWSDLAASYLVRAQRADNPRDLLRAYEAANRAVEEDSSLPEARFEPCPDPGAALPWPEAEAAWRDYLRLDATSGWAAEARERLARLARPSPQDVWKTQKERLERAALAGDRREVETIVDSFRLAAREYAEQELFGVPGRTPPPRGRRIRRRTGSGSCVPWRRARPAQRRAADP